MHDWSIDETGTIDTSRLVIRAIDRTTRKIRYKREERNVRQGITSAWGHARKEAEGVIRLLYENVNSLPNR